MKFYWFERINKPTSDSLELRSAELERYGFSGMLLPYGQFWGDNFVRIARSLDASSKFKYMVAIRPHVISGQYLAMICNSITEISKDRVMINFVAGAIHEHEIDFGGIIGELNDSSHRFDRKDYLCKYVDMFTDLMKDKSYRPDILVSGQSEEVISCVDRNQVESIIGYLYYKQDRSLVKPGRKTMVAIVPVIRETHEDLEEFKSTMKRHSQDIAFLTENEFSALIEEFKSKGIEDLLVHMYEDDDQAYRIYDCIKKYTTV